MEKYTSVKFKDKLGKTYILPAKVGQSIKNFLHENRIPINAVIVKKNNSFVSEDVKILENGEISIEMVRGYDLPYFREIKTELKRVENPIYTKRIFWFENGEISQKVIQFSKTEFIDYFEKTFLDTIKNKRLIKKGDKIAFGLSGGKDSISLLLLLQKFKKELPPFQIVAYTVADVLTENLPSFQYAKKMCSEFGLKHRVIQPTEIERIFHLNKPVIKITEELMRSKSNLYTIFMLHHIMRRMIESTAFREFKIKKLMLGLNLEDVLAGLLSAYTTGYLLPSLPTRKIGKFTYIFPLYQLTKKEIHLYVNLTAPPYSGQEPPFLWDLIPLDRGFYYFFSDCIQDIWPGIEHHLFKGFEKLSNLFKSKIKFYKCKNCGASILLQTEEKPKYCDICRLFEKHGYLKI